jgi:uncharacterized protein (TIGR02231 family)
MIQGRCRVIRSSLVVLACCCSRGFAADISVQTNVDQVTVYREGAIVTRTGSISLPQGVHQLVIKGLPAEIESKSLRVAVDSSAVRLGAVEIAKINEGKLVSDAERDLTRRVEEKNDERVVLQDEIATAQVQLKLLESLADNPSGSPTKAAVDSASLGTVLATMSTSATAAHKRVRDANLQLRAVDRQIEKLKADLGKIATRSSQSTEVHAALEASAATPSVVTVSYAVGDAGWDWIYEARLDTNNKRISLERQAEVHQGSGEDWNNAELHLTTAQPSSDVATPMLGSLFLNLAQPEPRVRQVVSPAAAAPLSGGALEEAVVTAQRRSTATVAATGYVTEYKIPARVTLLADRQPRVFPIAEDDVGVDLVARVVPSANRAAHLEAKFKYERDAPIEAGTMQLYRDGAFVGEAETTAFLPGAEVRMPFGADERIRVTVRDEAANSAERGVFSKQIIKETRQRFEITSFHSIPIAVEVVDRIPVSKHSDVHVDILKGATEPTTKDLDGKAGVMLWKFDAQPQKLTTIRNLYSVRYPQDRVLEQSETGEPE